MGGLVRTQYVCTYTYIDTYIHICMYLSHTYTYRVGEECLPMELGGQDPFGYEEALALGLAFCSLDQLSAELYLNPQP